MTPAEKKELLARARKFFRELIFTNHLSGIKKLGALSSFNYNPFLVKYIANFIGSDNRAESLAKALIYPRVLGTSINTIFGNQAQVFCKSILQGAASVIPGIDIEFVDQLDGRKKYCQIKAGPQTINKDDVKTVLDHFEAIKRLARTNGLDLRLTDLVVGIIYGNPDEISANYLKIKDEYPLYTGQEFWHRLTGDPSFYFELIEAFSIEAQVLNGKEELDQVILQLAADITANFPELVQ